MAAQSAGSKLQTFVLLAPSCARPGHVQVLRARPWPPMAAVAQPPDGPGRNKPDLRQHPAGPRLTGKTVASTMQTMERWFGLTLALASLTVACGRSSLDTDIPTSGFGGDAGFNPVDAGELQDARVGDGASRTDSASSTVDAGPPSCGACDGCCQGSTCVPQLNQPASACGWGGVACRGCPAGLDCVKGGACVESQPNCSPSNCKGCCEDAMFCTDGLTAAGGCGLGGQLCHQCQGATPECVAQPGGGGACGGVQTCNAENCPYGCCQGDVCSLGYSNDACGIQGNACVACPAGQSCVASSPGGGICQLPPFCTPENCSPGGCCQGNQCMPGTEDQACGEGGSFCTDCSATGGVCDHQHCVTGCSSSSCNGCCSGSVCAVGTQSAACGAGGVPCQNCASNNLSCISQACGPFNGN